MARIRIMAVVGARPNFMKIAPLVNQLEAQPDAFELFLVHTGQHYDESMSDGFFKTLGIRLPDAHLAIGSGSHATQVGLTMMAFERVLQEWRADWVLLVGDVNATCACSVTAAKERVKVAHVEAGLRSFDMTMPEEINRMVTDRLSRLLLTTDEIADQNLRTEGVPADHICRVGNIMIDTLDKYRGASAMLDVRGIVERAWIGAPSRAHASAADLVDEGYCAMTLHRPSNVDDPAVLKNIVDLLVDDLSRRMPVVWTIHPRTRKVLESLGLMDRIALTSGILPASPLGYLEMLRINMGARLMLTDSGGLQEECCVLGTPCVTLRDNTERPVTLRQHGGTCELAGNDVNRIKAHFDELFHMGRHPHRPPLWDGHAAERIVNAVQNVGP